MEEARSAIKIVTVQSIRTRLLGRCRWEDNIRMDVKETGINMRNWINLAQDIDYWRVPVNAALNLEVP